MAECFHMSGCWCFSSSLAYGGLIFLNRTQADAKKEILAQIDQKRGEVRPELVQQILALDQRFKATQALIQKHALPSKIFVWLEGRTHPRVAFSALTFDSATRKLMLPGITDSLTSLNQQIAIFEHDPAIEQVDFGGLSFGKGDSAAPVIAFQATIILRPSLIQAAQ